MFQETIETNTGVPRTTLRDWVKKMVADGVLTPIVVKLLEQISPRVEHGRAPSNGGSQTTVGKSRDTGQQEPQRELKRTSRYLPKKYAPMRASISRMMSAA